jgi:hypothetical protein
VNYIVHCVVLSFVVPALAGADEFPKRQKAPVLTGRGFFSGGVADRENVAQLHADATGAVTAD